MEYKGAQPPEAIAQPSVEQFKQYQAAARGWIKYITLSPEHDTDLSLIHISAELCDLRFFNLHKLVAIQINVSGGRFIKGRQNIEQGRFS